MTTPDRPRPGRIAGLDGVRALGALAVLTTHVGFSSGAAISGHGGGMLARLDIGVAIFFVLSGFLLHRPHVHARLTGRESPPVRQYLRHRVLRIMPAAVAAVVLSQFIVPPDQRAEFGQLVQVVTMTQIYVDGLGAHGLTQMWSLSTEVAFYLVLPLVALALRRWLPRSPTQAVCVELAVLLTVPVASLIWWWLVVPSVAWSGLWLPGLAGWFAVGMGLATWTAAREAGLLPASPVDRLAADPVTCWVMAFAVYTIVATPVGGPLTLDPAGAGALVAKNALYTLTAALLVLPVIRTTTPSASGSSLVHRTLGSRPAEFLGTISYGIFVYHVAILALVERLIGHRPFQGDFAALFIGTLSLAVGTATVSYFLIERPVMRWGRRHESRPMAVSNDPKASETTTMT